MSKDRKEESKKIVAQNKKAFHDFFIIEKYEAGIVLKGNEVKSLREHKVNLKDSYARIKNDELLLYNMHISPSVSYTHLKKPRSREYLNL